jgi:transcription termination/antitermination protein NusG
MNMVFKQRQYLRGEVVGRVDLDRIAGPLEVPMPKRWFMLRVHPNREFKVLKAFKLRNISGWVPTLTSMQHVTRYRRGYEWIERRNVVSPLITGVVIIPDFEIEQNRWREVDGIIGLYYIGPCLPSLTPQLFSDLCNIEAIGNTPRSKRAHLFEIGQLVRVVTGPFREFCGRVERFDSTGRLSVGVDIFSRITPVELSESEIEAV